MTNSIRHEINIMVNTLCKSALKAIVNHEGAKVRGVIYGLIDIGLDRSEPYLLRLAYSLCDIYMHANECE